jgi:hypothetical protein
MRVLIIYLFISLGCSSFIDVGINREGMES